MTMLYYSNNKENRGVCVLYTSVLPLVNLDSFVEQFFS